MLNIPDSIFTRMVEKLALSRCAVCNGFATRELMLSLPPGWVAGWGPFLCDQHTKDDVDHLRDRPDWGVVYLDQAGLVRELSRIQSDLERVNQSAEPVTRVSRYERPPVI